MLGIFLIVALAVKTDTETTGNVLDTVAPDGLVELGVNTDILGAHLLLSKSADGLDGSGGALLEGPTGKHRVRQGILLSSVSYLPWIYLWR